MDKILDENVVGQIREAFAELKEPVELLFFGSTKDCEYCDPTRQLLEEVSATHEALSVRTYDLEKDPEAASKFQVDKAPCLIVAAKDGDEVKDLGIRFAGIPSGHEFGTLIGDILMVSKRDSGLSEKTREYLKALNQPLLLQVFVTPTCPYCPRAVLLAHQMAMENPQWIRAEGVEATEFRELAEKYYVSGVPQTVINSGAKMVVGAVPEINLLAQIRLAFQN
ncbi:MAG TPA: thioredoxin family protein [Anaerolineales bacterium]